MKLEIDRDRLLHVIAVAEGASAARDALKTRVNHAYERRNEIIANERAAYSARGENFDLAVVRKNHRGIGQAEEQIDAMARRMNEIEDDVAAAVAVRRSCVDYAARKGVFIEGELYGQIRNQVVGAGR